MRWAPRKVDVNAILLTYKDEIQREADSRLPSERDLFLAAYVILGKLRDTDLRRIAGGAGIKTPSSRSLKWFIDLFSVLDLDPIKSITFGEFKERLVSAITKDSLLRKLLTIICKD